MNLVINASPVIFLTKLEIIDALAATFDSFIIPSAVAREIKEGRDKAAQWVVESGEKFVREIGAIHSVVSAWDLGLGESEVLTFAHNNKNFVAALDDKAARNCAHSLNIEIIGTIGLILYARRKNIISDAAIYLNKLCTFGYRIDDNTLNRAIELSKK